jgi:hypothetical protein
MHTSFVLEIIFYAIALGLFVACYAIFIRKRITNVQSLLRKTNVSGNFNERRYND